MATSSSPGIYFFEIDNALLRKEAKKPKYLSQRYFSARSLESAATKRALLLQAKKEKLQRHWDHVLDVAAMMKTQSMALSEQKMKAIQQSLTVAAQKRQGWVHEKQKQVQMHHEHIRGLHWQTQVERFQKRRRQRGVLVEKQKASEWRRHHLRKLSKTQWHAKQLEPAAAACIQAWWRYQRVKPLLAAFRHLKLSHLASMSFPTAARYLQQKKVLQTTERFLKQLNVVPSHAPTTTIRVFLTVFMLLGHTETIVENPEGAIEKNLLQSAQILNDALHQVLMYVPTSSSTLFHSSLKDLSHAWLHFQMTFQEFKQKDVNGVVQTLVAHALELARLLKQVSDHPNASMEFAPNVLNQLKLLQKRIEDVGGDSAWESCLEAFRQEQLDAALALLENSNLPSRAMQAAQDSVLNSKPLSPPPSTSSSSNSSHSSSPSTILEDAPRLSHPISASASSASSSSSPPHATHSTHDDGLSSSLLQNLALAHEIILDPEFQLQPQTDTNSLQYQVKVIAKRAFQDHVQQAWEAKQYDFLVDLVQEIQASLLNMVTTSTLHRQMIRDALDVDRVKHQVAVGQVDVRGLLAAIVDLMLRFAAPVRDSEIRLVLEAPSVSDAVMQIHALLESMHMDLANYHIKQLRPILQERAVEYEAGQFSKQHGSAPNLPHTRAWLQAALNQWLQAQQARNPENLPLQMTPKFEDLYHDALIQLLVGIAELPETFCLDVARWTRFQTQVQTLALVATLALHLKTAYPGRWDPVLDVPTLFAHVAELTLPDLAARLSQWFPSLPASLALRPLHEHPVHAILSRRIQTVLKQSLTQAVPADTLASYGLDSISEPLLKLAQQLRLFAKHNKAVHAAWYDPLLKELVQASLS